MAKWTKVSKINSGGFGTVFRAHADTGLTGAIKELSNPDQADNVARFRREVRLQSQLKHKHVVPILGHKLDEIPPWFLMPLATGNLRERMSSLKGNSRETIWIFNQILSGVEFAHLNGIIHRDLKPENILFFTEAAGEEFAAVGDFGLGRPVDRDTPSLTVTHTALGTPWYAAPELLDNAKSADHRADIFTLGRMLYELLTGSRPYVLDFDDVPGGLAYVIMKCTATKPDHRYHSIAELRAEFDLLTGEQKISLERPNEAADGLIRDIINDRTNDEGKVKALVSLLLENDSDEQLYQDIIPKLPDPVLTMMIQDHHHAFKRIYSAFDRHISGQLAFDYTDTAARLCQRVYQLCPDQEIRRIAVERILDMGYSHNRYRLRTMFSRLAGGLSILPEVLMVRDVLKVNPSAAQWVKDEVLAQNPHPLLGEYLQKI